MQMQGEHRGVAAITDKKLSKQLRQAPVPPALPFFSGEVLGDVLWPNMPLHDPGLVIEDSMTLHSYQGLNKAGLKQLDETYVMGTKPKKLSPSAVDMQAKGKDVVHNIYYEDQKIVKRVDPVHPMPGDAGRG